MMMNWRMQISRSAARDALLWAAAIALLWGLDTVSKIEERSRLGIGLDDFRLYTEQATSAIAVLVMVGFVIRWLDWFPFNRQRWLKTVAAHIVGSVLFALGHYGLMVAMRVAVFLANGMVYVLGWQHFGNLVFEYQKDVKIYVGIAAVIAACRFLRRRHATAPVAAERLDRPQMLLVQTGVGERLIEGSKVHYLQAARNYVSVFADGKEYLIRDTLASLTTKLDQRVFLRTHRSFIVNLAHIDDVRPVDNGVWEIRLKSGASVPLSRAYRDAVREQMRVAAGLT